MGLDSGHTLKSGFSQRSNVGYERIQNSRRVQAFSLSGWVTELPFTEMVKMKTLTGKDLRCGEKHNLSLRCVLVTQVETFVSS